MFVFELKTIFEIMLFILLLVVPVAFSTNILQHAQLRDGSGRVPISNKDFPAEEGGFRYVGKIVMGSEKGTSMDVIFDTG